MVLESTMICFDNSDYMRNEDYLPSRLTAQIDCVNLICMAKIRAHPQNDVGLMTISHHIEVLSTLTNIVGFIYKKLSLIKPNGDINFLTGIRIAQLVLKNRQQKDHKMRIIAFVGSPLDVKQEELVQLGKKFKKEKLHVDVVSFGEYPENEAKLMEFVKILNGTDELNENCSRLVTVPRGSELSEVLRKSPILATENDNSNVSNSSLGYGLDDDPDLALALRISLEEQRALEQQQRRLEQERGGGPAAGTGIAAAAAVADNTDLSQDELDLQRALAMSVEVPDTEPTNVDNMNEDQLLAYALRLSAEEAKDQETTTSTPTTATKADKKKKEKNK